MSNYTKTTDFDVKDSLPSGDTGKIIRGSEFEVEFENIEVAIASKADSLNSTLTGTTSVTNLSVTGNTTLGNAASDTVTVNADFSSDLLPSADATYDLGAPGSEWQDLYVTGTANVDALSCGTASFSANVTFGDNNKAIFGAGSDLQIYHDGSNSIIEDVGTGSLDLKGSAAVYIKAAGTDESMAAFVKDGGAFLYHNNSQKLATTASGVDVTGTVTADGLTVETATGTATPTPSQITIATSSAGGDWSETDPWGRLAFYSADTSAGGAKEEAALDVVAAQAAGGVSDFFVKTYNTGLKNRIKVGYEGNISFYEDTGTTPKLFWDASAESLGIGTSSPTNALEVQSTGNALARFYHSDGNTAFLSLDTATGSDVDFSVQVNDFVIDIDETERFRIDGSGNVGIGTSSPSELLEIGSAASTTTSYALFSSNTVDRLKVGYAYTDTPTSSDGFGMAACNADGDLLLAARGNTTASIEMHTAGSERMRIDSNGNVGINTAPGGKLSVRGTAGLGISDSHIAFGANQDAYITTGASGIVVFREHDGVSTNTERMRINSSGNVGIGTDAPSGKLHVQSAASGASINASADDLIVDNSGSGGITVASGATQYGNLFFADSGSDVAGYIQYLHGTDYMRFGTDSVERMRIDSSGNVGIGETTPTDKLHIGGTGARRIKFNLGSGSGFVGYDGVNDDIQLASQTQLRFQTGASFTERLLIDSVGDVSYPFRTSGVSKFGIRQASTNFFTANSSVLEIHGADATTGDQAMAGGDVKIRGGSSFGTAAGAAGDVIIEGGGFVAASDIIPGVIRFNTGSSPTERMRIDSSGNLLVGTTSGATGRLIVDDNGSSGNNINAIQQTVGGYCYKSTAINNSGTYYHMQFTESATPIGSITSNGSLTAYNTTSDVRLKENITDAPEGNVDALQVRSFDWKADGSHQEYGFIAQELEAVAPYAVTKGETEDDMWGVDYSKLVPMLVKEIQDLKARIATLEAN